MYTMFAKNGVGGKKELTSTSLSIVREAEGNDYEKNQLDWTQMITYMNWMVRSI